MCKAFRHVKRSRGGAVAASAAVLVVACLLAACPRSLAAPRVDAARVEPFQRGVGLGLFASDADYDYGHLLDEIVAHGATDVLLVVARYQTSVLTHDIAPRPGFTPSRAAFVRTLRQAKERGLRVAVLPIVRLVERTRTEWRGRIRPDAGPAAWFDVYGAWLREIADDCQAAGVERLGVGSELLSLERYEGEWRELILDVRERYRGKLFYSANWDHFDPIQFWDALDEVGVTAYFELTRDLARPTDEHLANAWAGPRRDLAMLRARVRKPLFITEIGYPSKITAARYPWDETREASLDLALQAQLYDAFCQAFEPRDVVDGVYFWNWFGFGGDDDGGYTPRKKPAAVRMEACLRRAWGGPRGAAARR